MLLDVDEMSIMGRFDFTLMGDKEGVPCEPPFGLPGRLPNPFDDLDAMDCGLCPVLPFNTLFAV